jgi:hypothetical protein
VFGFEIRPLRVLTGDLDCCDDCADVDTSGDDCAGGDTGDLRVLGDVDTGLWFTAGA